MEKLQKVNKLAREYGYGKITPSTRKNKKYMTRVNGKLIHFGAKNYEDFLDHQDPVRRALYRTRHSAIKLKDGRPAYKVFGTPAHASYYLLW